MTVETMGKVIRMDKQIEFAKIMRGLAEVYGRTISTEMMKIYSLALEDLSIQELKNAVRLYVSNSTNAFFPTPGQLRAMITPSDDQQAREASARIREALTQFGGDYDYHIKRAREHIGELGWKVVEKMGGWSRMTRMSEADLGPVAQAQWRELASSILARHRMGIFDEAPSIEFKPKKGELQSLGEMIRLPKFNESK